jgi:regulator of replication initiation timing
MNLMSATEEIAALQKVLASAKSELTLVRTERDLLKERLNKFMRKIFAAKSEVSSQNQKDMFFVFNEAEVLGAQAQPAAQEEDGEGDGKDVDQGAPAKKRGRIGNPTAWGRL